MILNECIDCTVPNEKITPQFFASGCGLAEQIAVKLVHGSRTVSGFIGIWGNEGVRSSYSMMQDDFKTSFPRSKRSGP